jgi:hypothetical protein
MQSGVKNVDFVRARRRAWASGASEGGKMSMSSQHSTWTTPTFTRNDVLARTISDQYYGFFPYLQSTVLSFVRTSPPTTRGCRPLRAREHASHRRADQGVTHHLYHLRMLTYVCLSSTSASHRHAVEAGTKLRDLTLSTPALKTKRMVSKRCPLSALPPL